MTRNSFIAGFFGLLGVARTQQSKPSPAGATGTMGPDDTRLTGIIRGGTTQASCKEDSDGIVTCRNTAYEGSQFSVKVHKPYLPKNGQCPSATCRTQHAPIRQDMLVWDPMGNRSIIMRRPDSRVACKRCRCVFEMDTED